MERVLQAVRMEALVNDLSHALEETTCSSNNRKRWGLCRRARSTGNLHLAFHATQSDDSDSISEALLNRDRGHSSLHQSDSDDMSPARQVATFNLRTRHVLPHIHALESDSVNENFSPIRPSTRRRRKLKRMAIDVTDQAGASTSSGIPAGSHAVPVIPNFSHSLPSRPSGSAPTSGGFGGIIKKRRVLRHSSNSNENRLNTVLCGKRKRSLRDRSGGDCDMPMLEENASRSHKSKSKGRSSAHVSVNEECMELSGAEFTSSSPSVSSNESDPGFFTTDEGREGDDEHSDWYGGDGRGWWEDEDDEGSSPLSNSQDGVQQGGFQAFFHMSAEDRRSLREGMKGRQIRAGRRRLRNSRGGFTVLTSANEKLSRFLQDLNQSELRLHPMQNEEKDQLVQLANLYSLQMRLEPTQNSGVTCPVLTKTRDTVRVEQISGLQRRLHADSGLKRRKLPPSTASKLDLIDTSSTSPTRSLDPPIFQSNQFTHSTGCQSN
ncbi:hypothetical protein FOCC_FOCC012703 [Frankliniella occidentalis]|nr:G patch domain-containing protein 2-like isoform X2 [Frankliniella occidentalis]KAE8741755.1 hypothetical protein FOCC_FOCC012703 [Frankliniella occidentalis]